MVKIQKFCKFYNFWLNENFDNQFFPVDSYNPFNLELETVESIKKRLIFDGDMDDFRKNGKIMG